MSYRSAGPILKTLLFVIFVPGTVLLWVPYLLLARDVPRPVSWVNWLALAPCGLGALILLKCAWDFAVVGLGTPAPIDPPKSLVVSGLYRLFPIRRGLRRAHAEKKVWRFLSSLLPSRATLDSSTDALVA
jgi:hypothetical protein